MARINTIHGPVEESTLARTLGFEERPNEFVVWVEWRRGDELVRRDAHCILKRPGEEAQAVLGAMASPQSSNDVTVGLTGVSSSGAVGKIG